MKKKRIEEAIKAAKILNVKIEKEIAVGTPIVVEPDGMFSGWTDDGAYNHKPMFVVPKVSEKEESPDWMKVTPKEILKIYDDVWKPLVEDIIPKEKFPKQKWFERMKNKKKIKEIEKMINKKNKLKEDRFTRIWKEITEQEIDENIRKEYDEYIINIQRDYCYEGYHLDETTRKFIVEKIFEKMEEEEWILN